MFYRKIFYIGLFVCCIKTSFSQSVTVDLQKDSAGHTVDSIIKGPDEQIYRGDNGKLYIYPKPKAFSFLTNLPKDAVGIAVMPFRKKSLKPLLYVAGSTALLLLVDRSICKGVLQFSQNINLAPEEKYKDVVSIRLGKSKVSIFKAPQNVNTALYQLGQGFPSLLIGAGLFTYGKIHKDYRALSTASQLAESFILMGVSTQLIKRITGRQSPGEAIDLRGKWHPFPSFKDYQKRTPYYDAFPSGHLATMMSTVTILAENYPQTKWIKPVGYSLIGLVGYSMINNKVHWASDYPLALALGYLCAKQVVKTNRRILQTSTTRRYRSTMSYTVNYVNGRLMPGLIYKF